MNKLFAAIVVVSISPATLAQNHELAVTFGGQIPVNASFDVDPGFAIQGSYAGRLLHEPLASTYFEFPVVVGLKNEGLLLPFSGLKRREYSSLFIAPGLRAEARAGVSGVAILHPRRRAGAFQAGRNFQLPRADAQHLGHPVRRRARHEGCAGRLPSSRDCTFSNVSRLTSAAALPRWRNCSDYLRRLRLIRL
ncbi:MAG TPA: hypothetical protein VGQ71_02115, partial [Terriglobales bacterium]|nr:hypothetical protein [Terriglobales bacterium]